MYVEVEMGLYDHFSLVQQHTSLCVLNVVQLSTLNDPNIDTDVSFIDPNECPHAGIYQWTSYYTVPENMIADPSLHYIPDFRITFSTDNGNRIGCTITGPIALQMIAAQRERDGLIALGIALCIFVSIFGILLLCSQYRRMSQKCTKHGTTTLTNGMLLQQQYRNKAQPRQVNVPNNNNNNGSTTTMTTVSSTQKQPPQLHHPYPYYNHNNSSNRSRTTNNNNSSSGGGGHYIRTLSNGQVVPVFGPPSNITTAHHRLPPPYPQQPRRFQPADPHHSNHHHRSSSNSINNHHHPHHRMALSTSVEEGEEDDDEEYVDHDSHEDDFVDDDDIDENDNDDDAAVSGHRHHPRSRHYNNHHHPREREPVVRSNPKYNETQLPSRPII